ncbi:hypothetical protein F5Y04DRAFT_285615 [Hypomontagnella monticulosa]|nr:hypothetical protein F5Y04DRAFT_285615 [Hypomontagnella monticulosa]
MSTICNVSHGGQSTAINHKGTYDPTCEFEDEQDSTTSSADTPIARTSMSRFTIPDGRSILNLVSANADMATSKVDPHNGKSEHSVRFAPQNQSAHDQACLVTPMKALSSSQGGSAEREPPSRNIHVLHSRFRILPAGSYSSLDSPFLNSPTPQRRHFNMSNNKLIHPYQAPSYRTVKPLSRYWGRIRDDRVLRKSHWQNVGSSSLGQQPNNKLNSPHQHVEFRRERRLQSFATRRGLNRHRRRAESSGGSVESLTSSEE